MSIERLDTIDDLWSELRELLMLSEIAEDMNEEIADDAIHSVRETRDKAIKLTFQKILELYEGEDDEHSD